MIPNPFKFTVSTTTSTTTAFIAVIQTLKISNSERQSKLSDKDLYKDVVGEIKCQHLQESLDSTEAIDFEIRKSPIIRSSRMEVKINFKLLPKLKEVLILMFKL